MAINTAKRNDHGHAIEESTDEERGEKKRERRVPNLTLSSEERRPSMTLVNFRCCGGVHNRADPDGARRRINKGDFRVGQNVGKRVLKRNLESQKNWKRQSLQNKAKFHANSVEALQEG
jgi:hypothetical protein